jgi:tetratricopeptide (TPR) repeat protein
MSNVALMRWLQDGPAATIVSVERALEFARQRHIESAIQLIETNALEIYADAGRIDDALTRAQAAATAAEASGRAWDLADGLCWLSYLSFERGDVAAALDSADRAEALARTIDAADMKVALAKTVPVLFGAGQPERALELMGSIVDEEGVLDSLFFAVWAPVLVRTALAAGGTDLAHRVSVALAPTYPLHHAAANAVRGAVAEAKGHHREAVAAYNDAIDGYRALGSARELSWSLLGAGRSRAHAGLGDGSAELTEARELFVRFGFHARAAEADDALQLASRVSN